MGSVTVSVSVDLSEIDEDDLIKEVESRGYVVTEKVPPEDEDDEVRASLRDIYEAMQTNPMLAWQRMAAMVEAFTGRIVTTTMEKGK